MKTKRILSLILIIGLAFSVWVTGSLPAQAQQANLDTTLARAAANSFLVTLLRPELSNTMKFYLLDSVSAADIVAAVQESPATSFEVTGAEWVSEVTYQVKAMLQPGDRPISVYVGKYNGRWRIEGVDLSPVGVTVPAETAESSGETAPAPTGNGPVSVSQNGGGQLVFQNQSGGDIYLINADGTGLRRITQGIDPQLSPDGTKIAFTRWTPRYELFTINVDGSNEQAWTHGWREMKSPTWTADGAKLIFSYQDGGRLNDEYHRINIAKTLMAGDSIKIPPEARDIEEKDGVITYRIPADAHWYLKQFNLNTGQIAEIFTERHSYGPSGHPTQANQVIHKVNTGITLHNVDTNTAQLVTDDYRDHTPVISPDGSKVAVAYWQDGHWEIHTMNLDGSNRQRHTETPLTVLANNNRLVSQEVEGQLRFVPVENPHWNNAAPAWSPDGSKIAFLTDRTGQWEIWIMNADGSDQRPMFPNGQLAEITLHYAGVDERMLSWR
ncbi:MAG: PD40 domain-containing protein [Anaerolineae bacterium]|nr:PD40 domain-containing protein [Anaerolineae bacterium]